MSSCQFPSVVQRVMFRLHLRKQHSWTAVMSDAVIGTPLNLCICETVIQKVNVK